jgi:hypothetical protein
LQQVGAGAQQLGCTSQQVGAGQQQVGSVLWQQSNRPAFAWLAAVKISKAALTVNHRMVLCTPQGKSVLSTVILH